ncbi:MAG: hypothetical protein HRT61_06765 [Ekhidna sp.]|nr:hypothetical protein [Ekhidna sp.]
MKLRNLIVMILAAGLLVGCGKDFKKSPLDNIIRDMPAGEVFSIILHDIDVQGNFSSTYYHQYEIIKGSSPETFDSEITDWNEVSEQEFNRYINDMGMEIAARDSTGQLTKKVAPPGYNNYVGNPKYGRWENRGGSSFWAFYGQYAFLSSMFRMATYPVRRDYYSDWRGSGRQTYYGPGGSYYGSGSGYNRSRNPSSNWNSKSSSFKSRVQQRASRSSGRSGRSSSSRSRGGGSGK